jgi:hypothetical protein
MNSKHNFTAILILATVLFTSCSLGQYVIYSVNLITPPETVQTIPITVNVKIFVDNRANIESNKMLFVDKCRETIINNKAFCINSEGYYITYKESVANQLSQMLVKHFNKAKLFANTSFNDEIGNDYFLTGTLNSLYGMQEFTPTEPRANYEEKVREGILLFGAIGGAIAAASNLNSPGKVIIEISDLNLFRKDGTLIKDFGNFHKEYEGVFPVNANCRCIYDNVNARLRDFTTELIEKIRAELLEVAFLTSPANDK